jgi:hypothetical protein
VNYDHVGCGQLRAGERKRCGQSCSISSFHRISSFVRQQVAMRIRAAAVPAGNVFRQTEP